MKKALNRYFSLTHRKISYTIFHSLIFIFLILLFLSYSKKNEVDPILDTKNLKNFSSNWILRYSNNEELVNLPLKNENINTKNIFLEKNCLF